MITVYKYLPREKIPDNKQLFNLVEIGITGIRVRKLRLSKSKLEVRHTVHEAGTQYITGSND